MTINPQHPILYVLPVCGLLVAGCLGTAISRDTQKEAARLTKPMNLIEVQGLVNKSVAPLVTSNQAIQIAEDAVERKAGEWLGVIYKLLLALGGAGTGGAGVIAYKRRQPRVGAGKGPQ